MYLLESARELHAYKMALLECQYIWANAKRHVLLMQYWSHSGRSFVTCGALQAVHLNPSLPGTYALV